jgi:hypothetical protein
VWQENVLRCLFLSAFLFIRRSSRLRHASALTALLHLQPAVTEAKRCVIIFPATLAARKTFEQTLFPAAKY